MINLIMGHKKIVAIVAALLCIGCSGGEMDGKRQVHTDLNSIPKETWESFAKRTTFFGHQSVGNNILNGLRLFMKGLPNKSISIIESDRWNDMKKGAFAHYRVGENMQPYTKIAAFERFMHNGLGGKVNAAFFKFCYIDINQSTDIESLFSTYYVSMDALKKKYPKTKFIHVTVPLTIVQTGLRAWVKKLIGRPIGGYADNAQRNRFNKMLMDSYGGKEPVFDLAAVESTLPDGSTNTYEYDGITYKALVPDYASDGRHLNEIGSQRVAQALTLFLINTL